MAPTLRATHLPHRPLLSLRTTLPTTTLQTRPLHARVQPTPIPSPTPFVPNPQTFLTLIGRSLSAHAAKIPSWDALFTLTPAQLRDLGIEPARSRKYLLRWRAKFARGEWGPGGECAHVDAAGRAEVRVVEVPVGSAVERAGWRAVHGDGAQGDAVAAREARGEGGATVTTSAGTRRIVVNVPVEAAVRAAGAEGGEAKEVVEGEEADANEEDVAPAVVFAPLSAEALAKSHPITKGIKYRGAKGLVGSHVEPIKGTSGQAAIIRVKEGLWEDRRGHKIDGGERRQAEVRAKRRAADRKAGR
ncbi:hypothetical protein FH972_020978 [Carpinus fangiana]|uniref:Small ribosomal subunit protein mS41 n=1 Tax=Carpinus fangiana TaxID=176857 RepID=A0A5N6KQ35_9ROSI|nr:hypothetical protein FH972_020978 [Carpinus fangiana]